MGERTRELQHEKEAKKELIHKIDHELIKLREAYETRTDELKREKALLEQHIRKIELRIREIEELERELEKKKRKI